MKVPHGSSRGEKFLGNSRQWALRAITSEIHFSLWARPLLKGKSSQTPPDPLAFSFSLFFFNWGEVRLAEFVKAGWLVGSRRVERRLPWRCKTGSKSTVKCRYGQSGKTRRPLDWLVSFDDFKKVHPSFFLKQPGNHSSISYLAPGGQFGTLGLFYNPSFCLREEI